MRKIVELGPTAYRWLLRHPFMTEDAIIGAVQDFPIHERKYTDKENFELSFNRKKNKKYVKITIWVHETSAKYTVYKMHSSRI